MCGVSWCTAGIAQCFCDVRECDLSAHFECDLSAHFEYDLSAHLCVLLCDNIQQFYSVFVMFVSVTAVHTLSVTSVHTCVSCCDNIQQFYSVNVFYKQFDDVRL